MSDALLEQMEHSLRAGKPDAALQIARQYSDSANHTRDSAIEIAKRAATVYRDFVAPPVEEFVAGAPDALPAEAAVTIQKALQRLFRLTEEWEKRLWEVHTERLVREVRDWVRGKHLEPAAANIARLMALVSEGERAKRANYIGNVLGTVLNNQREAAQLVALLGKNPSQYFLTSDQIHLIDQSRQKRSSEMSGADMDSLERQWTDNLTSAAVEIKNKLPDESKMGEPDEAMLRDAGDIFRSILRIPILREDPELFLDATALLLEFAPKEQTATAKLARVEQRTYNTLGYTAKKTVLLTFQDIGRNKFFTSLYKNWAKSLLGSDAIKPVIELMGALRTTEFADLLKDIKADRNVSQAVLAQSSTAQAAIGGEANTDELLTELRGLFGRKRLELSDIKRAEALITNLGNITKSPRTELSERRKIREFLRSHVPEDLTKLALHTAMQAFLYKLDEEQPPQKAWAVRVLTRALWIVDDTTVHHKGGEQAAELGFREPVVKALERVGPLDFDTLLRTMEPLTGRYGAAYMAAADILEKLHRDESLPLLERMLNNTLLHQDERQTAYQQEYYWDATAQQRRPLTKEKVLEPIVHAIGSFRGPASMAILKRYKDQIASGKAPAPSANVASFLDKFSLPDPNAPKESGPEANAAGGLEQEVPERVEVSADPATIKSLMKAVNKSYFFSSKNTRRIKKIAALTQLGQITPVDALDVIFTQLADKDLMVVSAAITCLSIYADLEGNKAIRELTLSMTMERLESKDPAMRQGIVKLLRELGPNRKDVKERLLQFLKTTDNKAAREAIGEMLRSGSSGGPGAAPGGNAPGEEGKKTTSPDAIAALELKREYLAARQAWLASGKKGDPPPKPPGIP